MKVLLDRSVLSAARVFEQCSREVSDPITRKPMRNRLAGLVATKCRQNVKTERGPIAAMAFRAASGELSLLVSYFSFEEGFRIAKYPDLPTYVDIFSGVGLSKFDWAISLPEQRGLLPIHLRNQPGNPTEQAAAFKRELGRLANPKDMESCVQNAIKKGSSESDIKHLKELATLLRKFGKKTPHIVDVLQLWTAHVVGIPYFATLDNKFIKLMTHSIKNTLQARPILPSNLCAELHIECVPFPSVEENEFYTIAENPLAESLREFQRKLGGVKPGHDKITLP